MSRLTLQREECCFPFKSLLKRIKVKQRFLLAWTEESIKCPRTTSLQVIPTTGWDVFKNAYLDLNELTETVSAYVSFCKDMITSIKSVTIYSNNKTSVSKSVKSAYGVKVENMLKCRCFLHRSVLKHNGDAHQKNVQSPWMVRPIETFVIK